MRSFAALLALALVACGGGSSNIPNTPIAVPPEPKGAPKTDGPDLSAIPPPGQPKPLQPKPVFRTTTKAGLVVTGVVAKEIPVVHCRVVVRAGNATSVLANGGGKSRAGIANVLGELMKDGGAGRFTPREVGERVDMLGADLSVEVGPDRAVFSLAVTKDKLDEALDILGSVVTKPRLDAAEFAKLKARELDRVKQAQKGSGSWMARSAMYRELFGTSHPYGEIDATDESLQNVELADVKALYKKLYVAGNAFVVVAGDVDPADVTAKVEKHFGGIAAGGPVSLPFPAPAAASTAPRVVLALKPGAKQADILVGLLPMPRKDPRWPELALAVHALGGGMSSRLFADVREKRSLAYSTSAVTRELANGPSVVALYAGTQTPLAPKSVSALLEHLSWIGGSQPVDAAELSIAKTSLETGFLFRLETIGAVAGLVIDQEVLGLPGKDVYDHVAGYRSALREASLEKVRGIAAEQLVTKGAVIAVAGDAALAKPLQRFGPVRLVDPEKAFATVEQLPHDPQAALDVPVAK